jgi:hypothetical protein
MVRKQNYQNKPETVLNICNFDQMPGDHQRFGVKMRDHSPCLNEHMLQQLTTYLLVSLSAFYVIYRVYGNVKKKKACDKCELMKVAKLPKPPTN